MTSPSRIIPRDPPPEEEPAPPARPVEPRITPNHLHVQSVAQVIIALAVVLFLLVQAKFILISLVTAIVLFSLTSDAINLIARVRIGIFRIPNWLASTLAVLVIAAGLLSITSMILAQVNTVLMTAISYTERAPAAIAAMFSFLGEDAESAIFNSIRTVEISGYLRSMAGQAGGLMQGTVLVILFVGFLFAERVWFTVKLTNFVGDPVNAARIEGIVASIIHRVNRYLLVKTGVSLVTGVMVWGIAVWFGLDLAVALGLLTFVLNYIPAIGSIIATFLVALVAFVQLGDPSTTLFLFVVVGAVQFMNGNVIDPMLMGRALRMSSFGIIISLAFWGAVWGIPGMFLSVPIMVGLMIVCSEIPPLRPIAILLSREGLPEENIRPGRPADVDEGLTPR